MVHKRNALYLHIAPGLPGVALRLPQLRFPRQAGGYVALMLLAFCVAACTPKPVGESTRLTIDDFETMAQEMAQSLLASDALAGRGPDSEPWVVSIDKVLNLSDDVMTQNEQWSIMAQVRGAAPIGELWDQKAVRFVLPPEHAVQMRNSPDATDFRDRFGTERKTTHTMTATFRSVTRAQAKNRSDLYYCQFDLIDLTTGEPVWSDRFEFKRRAGGHVWD